MADPAAEIQALKRWKQEMMEVESSWNEQEVGRLLNVELGQPIKASIQPAVESLFVEIQAMRDAIKDHLDAFAWMDGPEGWTESCQKLQSLIEP